MNDIIIVKLLDDKLYLNSQRFLLLEEVDIPTYLTFPQPIFLKLSIKKRIIAEQKLFVEILEYNSSEKAFFPFQETDLANIKKISFKSINTNSLLLFTKVKTNVKGRHNPIRHTSKVHTLNVEKFKFPIMKMNFLNRKVQFEMVFQGNRQMTIEIFNDFLLEQFDPIKKHFVNVLQVKRASVEIKNFDSSSDILQGTSNEIEIIDEKIIEEAKLDFLKKNVLGRDWGEEPELLTMDELIEKASEKGIDPKLIAKDEMDLFNQLLRVEDKLHYKHLQYLSSVHVGQTMKLRFVTKPFSYLFLIEGNSNYLLIWETYNTKEATYIWRFAKDISNLKPNYHLVEKDLKNIENFGKRAYLLNAPSHFFRIRHDYSENEDGFNIWKSRLEEVIGE